jgi:hypothetical protein
MSYLGSVGILQNPTQELAQKEESKMTESLGTIKDVATIAAPLTAAIVETWIKPKIVALYKYLKTDKAVFEHSLSTKFEEYLLRSYERHSFINVIVFQNQQKKLEDIYVPLTVQDSDNTFRIVIDNYKNKFLPEYKRVIITDTAGMGKSTLLRFLFLSCIKGNKGIPVFIELRKLRSAESVLQYIYSELNPIDAEFDKDFILKLIKEGDFIFFLDGYDEIPFEQRDEVTWSLQDFISKAGNNLFALTSRPESALASFLGFRKFNIQPLKIKESFRLLKRYDRGGELSREIIKKLDSPLLDNIREFLTNPLLVSLLYKSYEYKHIIPFKKHIFYRQVYDALFESHDLTKGGSFIRQKYSKLDSDNFHTVLRALGFITAKMGQIEFDKDSALSLLRKAKEHCAGFAFNEAALLKDLIVTVPLFSNEGNHYKWSHKSFQEYFAAQFICSDAKGTQDNLLRKMAKGTNVTKYLNVLDLCYDIDYKTFRKTIMYDLITNFLNHYSSTYKSIPDRQIPPHAIRERRMLTFAAITVFIVRNHATPILNTLRVRDYLTENKIDAREYFNDVESGDLLITFTKEEDYLMEFLGKKGEAIIEFLDDEEVDSEFYNYSESRKTFKGEEILKESLKYVAGDFYVVDDDSASILNQRNLFTIVNDYIKSGRNFILNPENCRRLKQEINDELKMDDPDLLLHGL